MSTLAGTTVFHCDSGTVPASTQAPKHPSANANANANASASLRLFQAFKANWPTGAPSQLAAGICSHCGCSL